MNMTQSQWSSAELGGAVFGDKRLSDRLVHLSGCFAASPATSLPNACGSVAATKAAYRYFGNARVSPAAILAPHIRRTAERVEALEKPDDGAARCVIVAQDTTSLHFTKQGVSGLGYLERAGRRGIFLHTALAISTDGDVIGQLAHRQWVRDDEDYGKTTRRKATPSQQKESDTWRQVRDEARQALGESVQMISVMDREADIFELLAAPRPHNTDYIIRVAQKHRIVRRTTARTAVAESSGDRLLSSGKLIDLVEAAAPAAESMRVEVARKKERPPRTATLSVRYLEVVIPPPQRRPAGTAVCEPVTVRVILVREEQPPSGEEPIEWVLVTTLPISCFEDARRCVGYYCKRWLIERFHYTLKSGLQVEELQLESRESLANAIATLSVVAWHLMHLMYHARVNPEASSGQTLEPAQWKALVLRQQRGRHTALPNEPPSMKQAMLWIAQLGGYRGRTTDVPGIKTLWRGLRRLADMTETYNDMLRLMTAPHS